MSDGKKMKTHTDKDTEDREIVEAIARDKASDPAPRLGEAAMARIMAEVPQAPPAAARTRPQTSRVFGLPGISALFRPAAWQAFAVAGVAGLIAGAVLPSTTLADSEVTPEQEFAIYLQSDDAFATLLEEDL